MTGMIGGVYLLWILARRRDNAGRIGNLCLTIDMCTRIGAPIDSPADSIYSSSHLMI